MKYLQNTVFILLIICCSDAFSQSKTLYKSKHHFENFRVNIDKFTKVQKPDFSINPDSKKFIARVMNALKGAKVPNFAGHYLVVEWGCGTSCQCSVIVDMIDGKVYDGICGTSESYVSQPYSLLFIADPPDENGFYELSATRLAPTEYVWNEKKKKLEKLK
jgi:hypothetical protein